MKVIAVRQPWAWLIVQGYKDTRESHLENAVPRPAPDPGLRGLALQDQAERGGIVGMVQLEDCVTRSRSKWFEGPVGWVLSKPKKLPFIPLKGQLGLFDPPDEIIRQLRSIGQWPKK